MKKIMITLALISAITSIDMIHASAPAAAAAGAGAGSQLKAVANRRMLQGADCDSLDLQDVTVWESADKVQLKACAEPKEFTVVQAMQFVQKNYDSTPLSLKGLEDMIAYTSNLIQLRSISLMKYACRNNGQNKVSRSLASSVRNEIFLPARDKLSTLQNKLIEHSKDFFTNIYAQALSLLKMAQGTIAKECEMPKEIEFNIQLRFFLEEKAGIAAMLAALKADKAKASTVKPAGGPALEEDAQEA